VLRQYSRPLVAVTQAGWTADEALGCHKHLHLHHKRHTARPPLGAEMAVHHRQHHVLCGSALSRHWQCSSGMHALIQLAPSRRSPRSVRKRPPTVRKARSSNPTSSSGIHKIRKSQLWPDRGTPSTTVTQGGNLGPPFQQDNTGSGGDGHQNRMQNILHPRTLAPREQTESSTGKVAVRALA
jgi:hypothetical protein